MLDLKIIEKFIYRENMHIYQFSSILEEEKKCVNCETALTKPISLNDETMYLSEYLLVNLPTI